MGIMNYIVFDKPNNYKIDIGNGYAIENDSRIKDKDNHMIINDDDYSYVYLNGAKINCKHIIGDIPYQPIFAVSGESAEVITGYNPKEYDYLEKGLVGESTSTSWHGRFNIDENTGDRYVYYGRKSEVANIKKYNGSIMIPSGEQFLKGDLLDCKKLNNGWYRCILHGKNIMVNGTYSRHIRTYQISKFGAKGNINIQYRMPCNDFIFSAITDISSDGISKVGVLTDIKNRRLIYDNFINNTNPQLSEFQSSYILFEPVNKPDEYYEKTIYLKDYTYESDYRYYRGPELITNDGDVTNMVPIKPFNLNNNTYYIYMEFFGIVQPDNSSPTLLSCKINNVIHNIIVVNARYLEAGLFNKFKPNKTNRVLIISTPNISNTGFDILDTYINGEKIQASFLRYNIDIPEISFFFNTHDQPSIANYKNISIFERNDVFNWTHEYCTNLSLNGFTNSIYKPEISHISLNTIDVVMSCGDENFTLKTKILPSIYNQTDVVYVSDNRNIAAVWNNVIAPKNPGVTKVRVYSKSKIPYDECSVTVINSELTLICRESLICWIDARDISNNNDNVLYDRMFNQNLTIQDLNFSNSNPKSNGYSILFNGTRHIANTLNGNLKRYTIEVTVKINTTTPHYTDIMSLRGHTNVELFENNKVMHDVVNANVIDVQQDIFNTYTLTVNAYENTSKLYINGELKSSGNNSMAIKPSNYILIMKHTTPESSGRYIDGQLASVKIYRRELTSEEVLKNYNFEKSIERI